MSAIHPARNTQTAYAPAEADQDPQESQKSSPKTIKSAENATLNRKSSHNDLSGKVEIPSLDDMTSYLLSNETIDKDNFPLLLPSQQKQNIGIPEIMQNYDYEQALRRNREKMEANAILQAQYDEMRREIDTLFRIAQTLALAGEYQQAINCYNKIISLNEKNGSAWIAKGHCYALMEQDFKALTTYQEALKVVPSTQKDEQVWYGIGLLYQKSEDWNNAEVYYRNVLRLEPPANLKAEVLYNIGMVLKSKGDYAESVKMFTNSILTEAFTPTRIVDILCQSGNLQEKMNDMEGALKTYKYALMINENQKSLLCAGWLCFQLDKVEQALIYMKKAEALIPEDLNISYIIARCHLKLKQHTTAYDCIHKCLSKEPTNDIYWGSLGILFAELNQLKQAYECFSKALKLDPKCPENFYNLGCLFELSSQPTDAVSMYEKCLDLDPTFHLAIGRMRKMTQINLKNNAIEVQFKHAPFVFNICKEIKPEKPLFSFMPANVSAPQMPILPVKEKSIMTELDYLQAARAKEAKLKQQASREMTEESVKPREAQSIIKPVRLDLLANKLGPQKAPSESGAASREVTSSTEDDVSSLKVSRPQTSEQNGTKLPPVGSLNSLINGLNTFSFLQNNYNNVNNFLINPVMSMKQSVSESEHTSVLLPNRAKTADEFPSVLKGAAPDLAKQLNGLQSLIAKNNMILQNNISPNFSGEGLKPIKTISSPIMRSSLSAKESVKRTENHIEIKVNSGFKAPHKASKSDNDEDVEEPELQKKVKLQTTSKGGAVLPAEN